MTGRPMSTISPVPRYRFPNPGIAYQSECHTVPRSPSMSSASASVSVEALSQGLQGRLGGALGRVPAQPATAYLMASMISS
jgi:hypothetical protein